MSDYLTEVATTKKFSGNVVIKIGANYYAIRQPDSGLVIASPFDKSLQSVILNPTSIDIRRVTTTISSYSFKVVDKDGFLTALVNGDAAAFLGQQVEIYLGRSFVDMPFADYFKLPVTRVKKCDFSANAYSFSSSEETDRMTKPIYDLKAKLAVAILPATTVLTMADFIDDFPTAGFLKLGDEFVSYSGVNLPAKQFTGVLRGELLSTATDHDATTDALQTETVIDNPINIILKVLISGGGGGPYDVLQSGLGIDQSLVDIVAIEALRDELFPAVVFSLSLYSIDSALKFLEEQLLMPNNLRLTTSRGSKLTLAVLDKAFFVEETDLIDETSITNAPSWAVDENRIVNRIEVQWDFNEGTGKFDQRTVTEDAASIASFGAKTPLKYNFKGARAALAGSVVVDDFSKHLLDRLSLPTPEISISTHIDKSVQTIGDKTLLESSQIPAASGTLEFANELEIISRSINFQTGDVTFKLAYTSFTNIRSCYIAPSNFVFSVTSQSIFDVPAGRGAAYQVGWKMRLFNEVLQAYTADAVNTILAIAGDTITFQNAWVTVLIAGTHRLKFADYDDVTDSQKRYCFVSDSGANFVDGKPTYKVTY